MSTAFKLRLSLAAGVLLLLAACASNKPAPVELRTAMKSSEAPVAPAVARPGYYIVKRGDTLYSIARQFSRDYHELADWNGLADPGVISVGQELRVEPASQLANQGAPADAPVVESMPVPAPVVIGAGPIRSETVAPLGAVAAPVPAGVVTEPKGGRLAYSEKAWKDLTQVPVQATPAATERPAEQSAPEAKPPAVSADSSWVWPAAGKVIASFNDSSNKGIDLAGNIGDDVVAASGGEVKYVGSSLRGYGNLVIIKHDNNYSSVYAHNQEILVKENQQVRKGQKIATLGKSDTDRPKLHFEIRRQGKPVDPLKYLPSR